MTDRSKSSRREFLKGRAALDTLRKNITASIDIAKTAPPIVSPDRQNFYLEHFSKKAMACDFELLFNMQQYPQSGKVTMAAFELIDRLEDHMSIYREHSEVSRINRAAQYQPVKVESNLFELLQLAVQIHDQTAGAFDITTLPLSAIWGFDRRQGRLPSHDEISIALKSVGCERLKLDASQLTVEFSEPLLSINLGGIGKGHALDRVVGLLESNEIRDFLLHGGQSSVVARGSQTVDDSITGWRVGLSHPRTPDRRLAEITLRNEALGTSGTGRQGFFVDGRRFGHIIDPRTGWPTDHFLSITVISRSAALSDALATAFFVMSLAEVESYCQNNEEIKAICVVGGAAGNTTLEWFNIADEDWKRM